MTLSRLCREQLLDLLGGRMQSADSPNGSCNSERMLSVSRITTEAEMDELLDEWTRLFYESAIQNPLAHPCWMSTWARHFVAPGHLNILTLRNDRGELDAVAPFYRQTYSLAIGPTVTHLQLLGTGKHSQLTELPQILTRPGTERRALPAIMQYLTAHDDEWDWVEVVLAPEQGWFEPQWLLEDEGHQSAFVIHKGTLPCVVLPLPATWEELRQGMKRNLKEGIRRGINRLGAGGHVWNVVVPANTAELKSALDELISLYQARAAMPNKVHHPDNFASVSDRNFLHDVSHQLYKLGHLMPYLLKVDGTTAAARLIFTANGTTFFSLSGFDPRWWSHSVATTLMAECLRDAVQRGDKLANLSLGPDRAKLRWSENLQLYEEFIVVGGRLRSRIAFSLFWELRAAIHLKREQHRQTARQE